MKINIGQEVPVKPVHIWRGNEVGHVVELCENGRFVVEFDRVGVGFEGGTRLMLAINDVEWGQEAE